MAIDSKNSPKVSKSLRSTDGKVLNAAAAMPTRAQGNITIDATNFPDDNFRAWLLSQSYGSDGILTPAEIAGITDIDVRDLNIADLTGIAYFTAVEQLLCPNNNLTGLDLSANSKLNILSCGWSLKRALPLRNGGWCNRNFCYLCCHVHQPRTCICKLKSIMKRLCISLLLLVGLSAALWAQIDQGCRETKMAEIVVLLPAGDTDSLDRLVGALRNTPEQKLLMLRGALEIAQTPEQEQAILHQIGCTGTFLGLITAGRYLDDTNQNVQQAAVQTVYAIALAHPEYYGQEVTALLYKAIAVNKDPEADDQKEAMQKHLAQTSQDDGFMSIFNGYDLTGWKGLVEDPIARAKMTPTELAERQAQADEIMRRDWKVEDGLLVFEGKGYDNLCSEKDYDDIEMYVDWRITAKGDAGIYLRGSPQVQIWDISMTNVGAQVGSGGLYNNQKHPSDPLVVADNPVNEWNSFYIKMIGEKVTVFLNGQLVVDNVILENYWDRSLPIFERDAIELQAHGERVEYRDIFVREIPRPDPCCVSDQKK